MKKERVLLVDDDPAFLEIMTHLLRAKGRELVTTADGVERLAEARKKTPDLIILDVKMPRMDGFTLIRHLRSDPAFASACRRCSPSSRWRARAGRSWCGVR